MDAELGGDGAHPPVLDEVVAQNLRLECVVDGHRTRRSVPGAPALASSHRRAPPLPADELADRARTEVAVHRMGRFGGHRRARLAHRNSMRGEFSTARGASGTVMRHFLPVSAFAAPAAIAALALGVAVPAALRALIPASCRAQRFTPSETAATCPAVLLAPITARTDEYLAPAPGTQKQPGIVHRSPRRGGLDDPRSPGNTARGAVRQCGSGRSLGRDRQVSTVRGCVSLLADSDLTPTHERRHRRCTRRRRPLTSNISSVGGTKTCPQRSARTIPSGSAPTRQSQLTKAVRRISALLRSRQQQACPLEQLRAFGPLRAGCPRSQECALLSVLATAPGAGSSTAPVPKTVRQAPPRFRPMSSARSASPERTTWAPRLRGPTMSPPATWARSKRAGSQRTGL